MKPILLKIASWVLKLGFVPKGWLTYGVGATAMLLGLTCALGLHVPGIDLPCPDDATQLILGGAGVIGFRRTLDK